MPQEIIELRLHKDDTASVKSLFDRLLGLVTDATVPGEGRRIVELRSKIEGARLRISDARDLESITALARASVTLCEEYFEAGRAHSAERERAIGEVIDVLRDAVTQIAREAGDFHTQLLGSSERLTKLTEITELHEIKRQISTEVQSLKQVVAERKKQEEQTYSRLVRRAETLSVELDKAREEASRDPLTRIANRGGFDRTVERWITRHWKARKPFALAMLDVDNFKLINDTHGHPIGDRVLATVAERLSAIIRDSDFVARYGGEEFVVMLEDMKLAGARVKLTEFLEVLARLKFEYNRETTPCRLQFTLSAGVTEYHPDDTAEDLVSRADAALYEAKRNGKNRVEVRKPSLLRSLLKKNSK